MPEEKRTIGYICPVCGQAVIASRTAFQLAAGDSTLPCPCGKSELAFRQLGDRCEVTVPCLFCARDHRAACANDALLRQKLLALSCPASGLGCCYIGEEGPVFQAMGEVLGELKDIAARGGVKCACGSADYGIKVGYSSVDLVCAQCGAALRLGAATPDDLDALCARDSLIIPGKKE